MPTDEETDEAKVAFRNFENTPINTEMIPSHVVIDEENNVYKIYI
jgi:hypothetical protein